MKSKLMLLMVFTLVVQCVVGQIQENKPPALIIEVENVAQDDVHAEQIVRNLLDYEEQHNVHIVSQQEFNQQQQHLEGLKAKLEQASKSDKANLQAKITYIETRVIRFADIKEKLL